MKHIFIILAALLLAPASGPERTYGGTLKAGLSLVQRVDVPAGRVTVEAWANGSKINCKFYDGSGNLGLTVPHATRCAGTSNMTQPWYVSIEISSAENKDIEYTIWMHPAK